MKFVKHLFYLTILFVSILAVGAAKVHASYDTSGLWTDAESVSLDPGINWKFDAASGTLTFSGGGRNIPRTSNSYPDNRPWFRNEATDNGQAIKKIVFEQEFALPKLSEYLFYNLVNLQEIDGLDKLDTSNVTSMSAMFELCNRLENFEGLKDWDVSNVTDMSMMFQFTGIENTASLSKWNVSNVKTFFATFANCESLANISSLANWDVGNAEMFGALFGGCVQLENIEPLSSWNTSRAENIDDLLSFTAVQNLEPLRNWEVKNVHGMHEVFNNCKALEDATALGNWNAENITLIEDIFSDCVNLKKVDLSSFNTRSVFNGIHGWVFANCRQLQSIKLGKDSVFTKNANLPAIDTSSGEYTGEWIGLITGRVYSSSDDFMTNYDGSQPDTYVWRKAPTYMVSYRFISVLTEKTLPDEITKLLPSAVTGNLTQEVITSPELSATEIITADGAWTFKGWDKAGVKIENADEIVTGTWQFTANPIPDKPKPENPDKPKPENPNIPNPNKPKPGNNTPLPVKQSPMPAPIVLSKDCPKNKTVFPKTGERSDILLSVFGLLITGSAVKYFISSKAAFGK
jgi:surface protein